MHSNMPGLSNVRRLLKTQERRCQGQTLLESIWQFDKTLSKKRYYYRHGRRAGLGPLIQISSPMMILHQAFHIQLRFMIFLQHSLHQIPLILTNHVLILIWNLTHHLMIIQTMVAMTQTTIAMITGRLSHRSLPLVYQQVYLGQQLTLPVNLLCWHWTTPSKSLGHIVLCSQPPYHHIASMTPKLLITLCTLKRKLTSTGPIVQCWKWRTRNWKEKSINKIMHRVTRSAR